MERHIITLDEHGVLHVPEVSGTAVWMNEPELMELFGVVAPHASCSDKGCVQKRHPESRRGRTACPSGGRLRDRHPVRPPVGHCPCFPSSLLWSKAAA